jgi:predicted TIM-barrel fold metal-dependent hydrolase
VERNRDPGAGIIDCCVAHAWRGETEVFEYLSPGWREYVAAHVPRDWHDYMAGYGDRPAGPLVSPMSVRAPYRNPAGAYLPGGPVDRPGALRERYLDAEGVSSALLCHDAGTLIPTLATARAATAFVRALNDWTRERWLDGHPELSGTILVPTQVPDAAAAEIRRMAADDRFGAVLLAGNGLGKPFGHPVYEPIHQAAAEVGLPVVIRAGGDALVEAPAYPVAGGMPGTEVEFRVLASQVLMTHTVSLIAQGVIGRYPALRFLLLGGGVGWITPFLWRMDAEFRAFRHDALWMEDTPSAYFADRFRVGTSPFVVAPSGRLREYLAVDPRLAGVLCYASGFPDREATTPEKVREVLPEGWAAGVLHDNAAGLLGRVGPAEAEVAWR